FGKVYCAQCNGNDQQHESWCGFTERILYSNIRGHSNQHCNGKPYPCHDQYPLKPETNNQSYNTHQLYPASYYPKPLGELKIFKYVNLQLITQYFLYADT